MMMTLFLSEKPDYPQKYFRTLREEEEDEEKNIFDIHSSKITHHPHIPLIFKYLFNPLHTFYLSISLIDDESKIHTK